MFEQQKIVIKSGEGKNYFEATANLDSMSGPLMIDRVMEGLRKMQRDRMDWAACQEKK